MGLRKGPVWEDDAFGYINSDIAKMNIEELSNEYFLETLRETNINDWMWFVKAHEEKIQK
jgi:hypothetical protein